MLTEVLRDAGHEVIVASSSEQALLLSTNIDAALVDLHLPGECGKALIRRLRERHATLPVILLTGDMRHGQSDASSSPSVSAGAADELCVLTKPFDIDELSRLLDGALSRRMGCAATA